MKKLAIFDFDGTLLNSLEDAHDILNDIIKENNLIQLDHKETTFEETILKLKNKNNLSDEDMNKYTKIFKEKYTIHPKIKTKPFNGTIKLLKQLETQNILLAINSKKNENEIIYFINKYFKDINFCAITGNNEKDPKKPDPTRVLKIIEDTNLKKEDCIYIGDSINDIKAAKNAGIDLILVSWGQSDEKVRKNNYIKYIVNKPSQIIKCLK